eukprot:CAMPEP_0196582532 /NCGR_PEP_ID=MMETSP1081-20130531/39376_1 /TAXON_ID=36882 /ORGANISM="Pyramimonas amylifera, Strain CCMP720" /LENGTH=378 /DNA_ID=CAMNT_0041903131 /DNA_START=164 /DNA_END=1300 /DNA_ORIENTATION=-
MRFAALFTVASGILLQFQYAWSNHSLSIKPGAPFLDLDGYAINSHGGGILSIQDSNNQSNYVHYWYGESKNGPTYSLDPRYPARVDMTGVSCYSSSDLLTWKNEGLVLLAEPKDPTSELHTSRVLERPKVLYNAAGGDFVMWFHLDSADYSLARTGVAVSSHPTGPFIFLHSFRPNDNESRDMTVFLDPQHPGVAWLVHSSEDNMVMHVAALTPNFRNVNGTMSRTLINLQREAPAVFYHNHLYYLLTSGCTGWAPNQAEVFVAIHMLGPWESLGDPVRGNTREARLKTFYSQPTFVVPLPNLPGRFLMMADRWNARNLSGSGYVWLPLWVQDAPNDDGLFLSISPKERMVWSSVIVGWFDEWSISEVDKFPKIVSSS